MNVYPNSASLVLAGYIRTALAASKLRLFKGISQPLSVSTILANFVEADYDGYVEKTIATWLPPYLDPVGGASFQSGTQQFDYIPGVGPEVPNTILGFYIINATGALIAAGTFTAPVAMAATGDSIPLNVTLNWARTI